MSVLFKVLNFIVITQKLISTTYICCDDSNQYSTGVTMSMWGAGGVGTSTY